MRIDATTTPVPEPPVRQWPPAVRGQVPFVQPYRETFDDFVLSQKNKVSDVSATNQVGQHGQGCSSSPVSVQNARGKVDDFVSSLTDKLNISLPYTNGHGLGEE